ncbi:MAG: hypothetical protein ACYDCO_02215 [Armatimonadota bacterium]
MVPIVITAIVTFVVVSLWQLLASRRNRKSHQMAITALITELDTMAKKLGYSDLYDYWKKTQGEQYATVAMLNVKNLVDSFSDRGAD